MLPMYGNDRNVGGMINDSAGGGQGTRYGNWNSAAGYLVTPLALTDKSIA